MRGMVEKPPQGTAASNLSIADRSIVQPEIFDILKTPERGVGGEIQLTDGTARLTEEPVVHRRGLRGCRPRLRRRDRPVRASLALALQRPDMAPAVRAALVVISRAAYDLRRSDRSGPFLAQVQSGQSVHLAGRGRVGELPECGHDMIERAGGRGLVDEAAVGQTLVMPQAVLRQIEP